MTTEPYADTRATSAEDAVAAARRVIAGLVRAGELGDADMASIADRLNDIADELDATAPPREARLRDMWGNGRPNHDPVAGGENPIAPPLTYTGKDDGSIEAEVTLDLPYQGPPSCVHGGISALLLDHTLGVANGWAGLHGMTAELTLRYHRTTPLFEPLTITGRHVSKDGRKIRTIGGIYAGGEACVTAEGLFVTPRSS